MGCGREVSGELLHIPKNSWQYKCFYKVITDLTPASLFQSTAIASEQEDKYVASGQINGVCSPTTMLNLQKQQGLHITVVKYLEQNTAVPGSGGVCACLYVHMAKMERKKWMPFTELPALLLEPSIWFWAHISFLCD